MPEQFVSRLAMMVGVFGWVALVVTLSSSPVMGVGIACGLVIVVAMVLSPKFALLITVVVVPLERLGRFADHDYTKHVPIVSSLMRVVGVIALASLLLHACVNREKLRLNGALLLYCAFVAISFLSCLYVLNPRFALGRAGTVSANLMFLFLIINVVRDWDLVMKVLLVWLTVTVLIGIYQVYDWHFGETMVASDLGLVSKRFNMVWLSRSEAGVGAVRRATGTTSNASAYGINLILTVPFFAYFYRVHRSWTFRALALIAVAIVLYNMFLTNTRGVILFGISSLLLCVLLRLIVVTPLRVVAVGAAGLAIMPLLPAAVYQRALDPTAYYSAAKTGNIRGRLELWGASIRALKDHWLTGVGSDNLAIVGEHFDTKSQMYGGRFVNCHNEYLTTLVENGIFGFLVFWSFVGLVLWYSLKAAQTLRRIPDSQNQYWFLVACQAAMLNTLLFAIHVDVFHTRLKGWWLIAGLVCVTYHQVCGPRGELARERADQ